MNDQLTHVGADERRPGLLAPIARRALSAWAMLALVLAFVVPAQPAYASGGINVNITADEFGAGVGCSLREAIKTANDGIDFGGCTHAGAAPFTVNVPAGIYQLYIFGSNEDADATGDLDVTASNTVIQGSGTLTTIIRWTPGFPDADRVLDINPNKLGTFDFTLSGITIQGGREVGFGSGGMRSSSAAGTNGTVDLSNCTFTDNLAMGGPSAVGGAISHAGGTLVVNNCTFDGNSAYGSGGAIAYDPLGAGSLSIYNSTFTNNTSTNGNGGALRIDGTTAASAPTTLIANTFTGNTAQSVNGMGGAIVNESGTLNMSYSRIVNNSAGSGSGSGLYNASGATTNVTNNWWGCNGGPGTSKCNTVADGSGGTSYDPWIVLSIAANPNPITMNQATTLTASFLQNSNGQALTFAQIEVLMGLPVRWENPVNGSLSNQQTTVGFNGMTTATFTANAAGAGTGHADATVDNGTATANITIDKADTTTAITADTPDPSIVGQAVAVNFTVAPAVGGGTPTGNVAVSDGTTSCTGTVAAGQCAITFTSAGARSLTATYMGDSNFGGSISSAEPHAVNSVATGDARLVADPCIPGKRALQVSGMAGNDTIQLSSASGGKVKVTMNGADLGTFTPTGLIIVSGQAGDDRITVDPKILQPRILYGNDGNDTLKDGFGLGVLIGGAGDDTLSSTTSRDILIGGMGADTLTGSLADDIVIAGGTGYDEATTANQKALCSIYAEWSRLNLSYQARIDHLTGAAGGGLNGANLLKPGQTVFDDTSKDRLTGGLGQDWFLLNTIGASPLDTSDRKGSEIATDL